MATEGNLLVHDELCENLVLGTIMSNNVPLAEVREYLDEDCFYDYHHKDVWKAVVSAVDKGNTPDLVNVLAELSAMRSPVEMFEVGKICQTSTWENLAQYAIRLRELKARRMLWVLGQQLVASGTNEATPLEDLRSNSTKMLEDAFCTTTEKVQTLTETFKDVFDIINRNITKKTATTGSPTGFSRIDMMGGLQHTDLVIVAGESSQGKALRMDEKILTPSGEWILNRDIKVGDAVASIDGQPSFVTGVYPQGIKDMYKITFADGRVSYCSGDHLWEVSGNCSFHGKSRVMDTLSMKRMLEHDYKRKPTFNIPAFSGEFGIHKDFVISPYIMGVLIGDGSLTRGAVFCKDDKDKFIVDKVRSLGTMPLVQHNYPNKTPVYVFTYSHCQKQPNHYIKELERYGLWRKNSYHKFIPDEYLTADRAQRLALLNGLMDTDGYICYGGLGYATVSKQLAYDIRTLCHSLGYRCSINTHKTNFKKPLPDHYRLTIACQNESEVFTLPRKRDKVLARVRVNNTIQSIEYIGQEECQCIKVSHPRELFVISDYIVTHNTSFAMNAAFNASQAGDAVVIYSMEMMATQLAARILSSKSGISSSSILYNGNFGQEEYNVLDNTVGRINGDNIFFDDNATSSLDSIINSIRTMKIKHNIKGAVVDYLQILNVNQKNVNPEQAMGEAARRLKNVARELKIWVIALSQLSRDKDNPRPNRNRLRQSGQIFEAADTVIFIYRPEVYGRSMPAPYEQAPVEGMAFIDVDKGRNTGPFNFLAKFDAATTTFSDYDSGTHELPPPPPDPLSVQHPYFHEETIPF